MFFTNIDLTPTEVDELNIIAKERNIKLIEIYYRERIRISLDSSDGLGIRFQYLNINLSEAEQAAFFSRWEKGLESLILKNFNNVDQKLARIEFLSQMSRDIQQIHFLIQLDRGYTADELGKYKFVVQIFDSSVEKDPWDSLYIAGFDQNGKVFNEGEEFKVIGIQKQSWYNYEEKFKFNCSTGFKEITNMLNSSVYIGGKSLPFLKMQDLDNKSVYFYLSKSLLDKLKGIFLIANNYIIVGSHRKDLHFKNQSPLDDTNMPKEFYEPKNHLEWIIA